MPVSEADSLLAWDTSEVDDETEENETSEGDDLDEREPELNLSEPLDTKTIDSDNKLECGSADAEILELMCMTTYCDEDSDPCCSVDALVPESDDESTGDDLSRTDDEVFTQVDKSSSETESGVDTSSGVAGETFLGRESGRHFSQSQHD